MAELLLKVALITINLTVNPCYILIQYLIVYSSHGITLKAKQVNYERLRTKKYLPFKSIFNVLLKKNIFPRE